jgi:hypothetical protein
VKISKQRLKEIVKEELAAVMEADAIDSRTRDRALDSLKLSRGAREAAAEREKSGEPPTIAGTQNLRRFDPREKQPSDPDEVGLDTLEMPEKEYEQWRSKGFFDKDKF